MASEKQIQAVEKLKGLFAGLTHYAGATEDPSLATEFALKLTKNTPVYEVTDGEATRNLSMGTSYRRLAEQAMMYYSENSLALEQAFRTKGIPEPEKAAALIEKLASFKDAESLPVDEITGTIDAYLQEARNLSSVAQQEQINNLGGIDNVVYIYGGTEQTKGAENAYSFKRYQAGTEAFTWFLDRCKKDGAFITDAPRLAQALESKTTPLQNKYGKTVDTLECVNRAVNRAGAANEIDLPMVEKFLQQAGVDHPLEAAKLVAAIREYALVLERDESEAARLKALEAVQQSIQRYVDAGKPPVGRDNGVVQPVNLKLDLEIDEEISGTVVEIQQDKAIHAVADVGAVNASRVDVVTHTINQNKTGPSPVSPNKNFSETTDAVVVVQMPEASSSQQVSTVNAAKDNIAVKPVPTPEILVPAEPQKTTQVTSPKSSQSERLPVQRQAEQQPQLRQGHPAYGILGKRTEEQRGGKTVYVTPVQDVGRLFGLLQNNPQAVQQVISPSPATATVTSYPLSRADEEKIAAAATQQQRDAQAYADKPNMVRAAYAKQLSAVCGANLNITIGTGAEAFNVKVPLPAATPKATAMAKELRDPKFWGTGFNTSGLQNMTQEELASAAVFAAVAEKIKGKNPETQKVELAKLEKLFAAADTSSSFVQYAQQATSQLLAGLGKPRAVDNVVQVDSDVLSVARNVADKSMAG